MWLYNLPVQLYSLMRLMKSWPSYSRYFPIIQCTLIQTAHFFFWAGKQNSIYCMATGCGCQSSKRLSVFSKQGKNICDTFIEGILNQGHLLDCRFFFPLSNHILVHANAWLWLLSVPPLFSQSSIPPPLSSSLSSTLLLPSLPAPPSSLFLFFSPFFLLFLWMKENI